MIWRGHHCYSECSKCGKWVRLNKWIFGGLHFCLSPEPRIKRSVITYQDNEKSCGYIEYE